ncbi:MAG: pyridoxal phosphate-dependent aminotransferase [Nitrospinae bacterium]|nr:pyridoxal phosphate-dependent aminotransferase [Nitrospinota bacterium]
MPISAKMAGMMERSSWIRRMFEEGERLSAELGRENVFDFTLGNPTGEPPREVRDELARLANEGKAGVHRYMPNAGLPEVRRKIAEHLARESGELFGQQNVIMTVGAGGALNVIMKALLDPGDEVAIFAPYFAEYVFYVDNHQGKAVVVETDGDFQIDVGALDRAVGAKTRVIVLNSPNNPTGAVYPESALKAVAQIADEKSRIHGRPVYIVMDEPYRKLTYDNAVVPNIFKVSNRVITATSHSKDLNLPGERIGHIAIHPGMQSAGRVFDAMTMSNRILGFVNAPALFQRLVAGFQDTPPQMDVYAANRRILLDGLASAGYRVTAPMGGFYIFARSPVEDDVAFAGILKKRNILVVPGVGFGRKGHFRIAFCCGTEQCKRAIPGFKSAMEEALSLSL